ncbi:coiled-coil domain-containing protein 127 isoform X1 [Acinonyx jubatus]|uniref:Coiled-coil domain-containing protein 127 isoform X1 n=1 Tax=Acinonyx jubatus TaxID=32536 RepID=A0ABM3PDY7_ACIJB|nr:coiled-coil domain-containing protein 127 isoform X1 [Acinonyx jubatus]
MGGMGVAHRLAAPILAVHTDDWRAGWHGLVQSGDDPALDRRGECLQHHQAHLLDTLGDRLQHTSDGWIWSRESQKEIEKEREAYRQRTAAFQRDLEAKYHAVISENRRAVAHLSLELEKEQNRTTSYREALISQGRKLVEEKKLLEQERAQVMQEKRQLQPLRSTYLSFLEKEEDWQRRARLVLKEFEDALTERQSIYCSLLLPRSRRLEIEKRLLVRASTDPVAADLHMAAGLTDIFKHDTYCGDVWNTNRRQNGRLMWLYLKYWELIVELKKYKAVEKAILEK